MRKRKNSITQRDKSESHEGLLLIAGLIARHHVKHRLTTYENQTEHEQNGDNFLSTNTQESQNIDNTDVQ